MLSLRRRESGTSGDCHRRSFGQSRCAGARALGVPHRRCVRQPALRLRRTAPAIGGRIADSRWRGAALSRPGGSRIGLANKLRAYELQDGGHDTIDADMQLGFEADERRYAIAAAMLRSMDCRRIRLMTNNPDKIEELAKAGISIVERLPS